MVKFLITALLAAAQTTPIAAAAPSLPPAPAMWVVRDADTTIYLFGTFHALDGRSDWFTPRLREAFSNADELILETMIPGPEKAAPPLPAPAPGTLPSMTMRSFSVAPGASFMATAQIAVSAGRDRGMQVVRGADMVLLRTAETEGKQVEGLETLDFQVGMFQQMSPVTQQPVAVVDTPQARARLSEVMAEMQFAWCRGDQRIFVALLDEMRRSNPDNYRAMFPDRNVRWADWIVNRLDRPGTLFVAVGAGHFAGPDSLLSKLTLRGVVSVRAN